MKSPLLGSTLFLTAVIGGSAWAADMPRKAPPAAPAAAPAAPAVTWTGCYIGGNIGAGSASKNWANPTAAIFAGEPGDHGEADFGGFIGGGQIGCDYQLSGTWLTLGIQGMFDGADLKGNVVDTQDPDFDLTSKIHWFGTVTGRIGFTVQPNWLLYVKGGGAWVRDHYLVLEARVPFDVADLTRSGWTVGAGAEWMFIPNWSLFVGYDFMDFGTKTIPFNLVGGGFNETWGIKQNIQVIMAGINFRFNWGKGKTPVVAKF
jgi:outer membrane immunogenic protein